MSSGGKGKEEKSQVNLNVDFISGISGVLINFDWTKIIKIGCCY